MSHALPQGDQSLSAREIASLLSELERALTPGRLQEVHDLGADQLFLTLRVPGITHTLLIDTSPQLTHLRLVQRRPKAEAPPRAYTQLLRKELVGRRLTGLQQLEDDRFLKFTFERPEAPARALIARLSSRHGRSLLLDHQGQILGCSQGSCEHGRLWIKAAAPEKSPTPKDRWAQEQSPLIAISSHYEGLAPRWRWLKKAQDISRALARAQKKNKRLQNAPHGRS